MRIITVTGYKGGVGKSTTAFHIATYFSDQGKTLLVDGDQNRTALKWAKRCPRELPFSVADERQSMRMVPGSDFVIIDTPARPNTDDLKELAKGCDLLILPTAPDVLSLEPMLETARDLADLGNRRYRALITIVPPLPSKEGELMKGDLKEGPPPVFETMVRRTVGFPKAALAGVPVRDIDDYRTKVAWEDYVSLGKEIEELLP
jgi:chromosome partitioning protein